MFRRFGLFAGALLFSASACLAGGTSKMGSYSSGHNWAGIYIGVHGGGGEADLDTSPGSASPPGTPGTTLDIDGGLFGILGGVNWQSGRIVYGVEGDLSFGDIEGTNPVFTLPSFDIDTMGTIRGRLGVAFNRLMIFGTAGVGFVSADASERGGASGSSGDHTGFVGGVGGEFAFNQNLIGRIEYLHGSFDDDRYAFALTTPHTHDIEFDMDIVRGALIWKFGGHHAPPAMK